MLRYTQVHFKHPKWGGVSFCDKNGHMNKHAVLVVCTYVLLKC